MLVDSHCHLDYLERDGDLDAVVARARTANVGAMVTICTRVTEFPRIRAIAERFEDVWCTVGIHPHEAAAEPATAAEQLIELAEHPKVVGIGETGLDYYYEHSPRDDQVRSFRAHILAARRTGLPIVIHTRDADDDTIQILTEEHAKGGLTGLIHCYSTGPEVAEKAVKLGLYISLAGILTFKRSDELRKTVARLPLDRLLVETDAPYLAPEPKRGTRNEPALVIHTAARMAEIKGLATDEMARVTTNNFYRLFRRAARPDTA